MMFGIVITPRISILHHSLAVYPLWVTQTGILLVTIQSVPRNKICEAKGAGEVPEYLSISVNLLLSYSITTSKKLQTNKNGFDHYHFIIIPCI